MITRRRFAVIAAASTLMPALADRAAFAQACPTRAVHFIVPVIRDANIRLDG
jgi:hypothetical protein